MPEKMLNIRITLIEDVLGTSPANPEIHREFIASKAANAATIEEEVEAVGAAAVADKSMTIFPRKEGRPFIYDYQFKGFLKEACSLMARVPGSKSSKLKAYRKVILGTVHPGPRYLYPIAKESDTTGNCQRPLLGNTPQGPRVCLANSETISAGSSFDVNIRLLDDGAEDVVREWLDFGALVGLGQWRGSGKGRFTWQELPAAAPAAA